ncbi:hypothetical protein JTE90_025863 [Oedothorax gibbosus]|uniref:Uncharacterized protein n=1 Tax=Oedothorax gibbosus TaxID=931172 RepID=A0AAV6UL22_9ARAC|nr:hypothetical protein JTE90_025863 [Oedothorax gibbosus]
MRFVGSERGLLYQVHNGLMATNFSWNKNPNKKQQNNSTTLENPYQNLSLPTLLYFYDMPFFHTISQQQALPSVTRWHRDRVMGTHDLGSEDKVILLALRGAATLAVPLSVCSLRFLFLFRRGVEG